MKNKLYLLIIFVSVGFSSCQKGPYATFQKSKSETFERTVKAKPAVIEAVEVQEAVQQLPETTITASISDEVSFVEPANLFLSATTAEIQEEVAVVPVASVSKIASSAVAVPQVSGKNRLLSKILAKKVSNLNKKAEKANSSTVRGTTKSLLIVGLAIIGIGLLLTLIPILNVLSGIVIAIGAIIAIIGLLQQLGVM